MSTHGSRRPFPWRALGAVAFIALVAAWLTFVTGCAHSPAKVRPSAPVPSATTAIVTAHKGKDAIIIAEAGKIDAIAPAVREHTDAQRAAVAAAPAVDVERLNTEWRAVVDSLTAENARLAKDVAALKGQALREQSRWLTWAGVGLLAAFGLSIVVGQFAAALKTWPLAVLGAGCFGLAQLISHPWFLRGFTGLLLAGLAYSAYYVFDRHKEGRLRRSLEKKAAVLGEIVPVLDAAYESSADTIKQALDANVFARLSSALSKEDKALVHKIRAEKVAA